MVNNFYFIKRFNLVNEVINRIFIIVFLINIFLNIMNVKIKKVIFFRFVIECKIIVVYYFVRIFKNMLFYK